MNTEKPTMDAIPVISLDRLAEVSIEEFLTRVLQEGPIIVQFPDGEEVVIQSEQSVGAKHSENDLPSSKVSPPNALPPLPVLEGSVKKREAGLLKGKIWMADDFDAPLE
jgi:hypothetical protein